MSNFSVIGRCYKDTVRMISGMNGDYWHRDTHNLVWVVEETIEEARKWRDEMKENSVWLDVWIENRETGEKL